MLTKRSVDRGEEGGIAIVLLAMVMVLLLGAGYAIRYGGADEVSGQTRTASDAAALAGADDGADWVVGQLAALVPPTNWSAISPSLGQIAAGQYAADNGGTLQSYTMSVFGKVRVTVTVPEGDSGKLDSETSVAQIPLPVCLVVPPPPTPSPTPTPTPTPTASPSPTPSPSPTTPPPPPPIRYSCSVDGPGVHGGPFDPSSAADRAALRLLLEPRLVSVN